MSTIRRTSNQAEWTGVDGIYIDELPPPISVRSINNNVPVVIGAFQRGPVDKPVLIGGSGELIQKFGYYGPQADGSGYGGFVSLLNKKFPGIYVIRISNSSMVAAGVTINEANPPNDPAVMAAATSVGSWGNAVSVLIEDASDGDADHFNVTFDTGNPGEIESFRNVDTVGTAYLSGETVVEGKWGLLLGTGNAVRPGNGSYALVGGVEGTFGDADYIGSVSDVRGIQVLYDEAYANLRHVFVGEYSTAAVKAALVLLAETTETKMVYINGDEGDDVATVVADVANYRSDRVVYANRWVETYVADLNQGQGGNDVVMPNSFVASLVCSVPPGEDPAGPGKAQSHAAALAGIVGLSPQEASWAQHRLLNESGVAILQFASEIQRYTLRNGVTTSLQSGLETIARRTITDYLQESVAPALASFQNFSLSADNMQAVKATLDSFLSLQQQLEFIPTDEDLNTFVETNGTPLIAYEVDITSGNTPASLAQGIFVVFMRVRTFASMRFIVLRTEIGQGVVITAEAA